MINIDLTTKNTVYNTLGPQAQWVQHRFGKRDYPDIELDTNTAFDFIKGSADTINFNSVLVRKLITYLSYNIYFCFVKIFLILKSLTFKIVYCFL